MKPTSSVREDFLEELLAMAEEDLALVRHLVQETSPFRKAIVCHAREATEEFLTAFLVWHRVDPPPGGGLARLLELVAMVDSVLARVLEPLMWLSGSPAESVADPPRMTGKDACRAHSIAELTRESVRDALCSHV